MSSSQRLTTVATMLLAGALVYLLPTPVLAASAEVISTGGAVDITDTAHLLSPDEHTIVFAFEGEDEATYDLVFATDGEPTLIVTVGADMTNAHAWEYDAATNQLAMQVTYQGIVTEDDDPTNSDQMFIVTLTFSSETESDGSAPTGMDGVGMATNMLQWLVIAPTPDSPYFGFQLTGTPGTTGFFHMFIPGTGIDHLASVSGEELDPASMAVFVDGQQASLNVTEVDGGAYIDLNITFDEDLLGVSSSSSDIIKKVTTGPKEPISLVAKKNSLSQGGTNRLYGWIKQTKANQAVAIYRKLKGESKFTVWKTVETNSEGYYKVKYTAKKTGEFKAKYKKAETDKVKVTVSD